MAEIHTADWIGRSVETDDTFTPRLLAAFRATLAPHLHLPGDASEAPPGFHWCLAPALPGLAQLDEDGSEAKGRLVPPIPLPRRMWAGGSVATLAPIRSGASIRRRTTVERVERSQGRTGELCFVALRHLITADGAPAVSERQDLVFRAEGSEAAAGRPAAAAAPDLVWTVDASMVLLFRFSALAFNGHRIHYDQEYCRSEGYARPLVQGPLQAALMLNQLSVLSGAVPHVFDYRCVAPLLAGPGIRVESAGSACRILRPDGAVTAEGRVRAPDT